MAPCCLLIMAIISLWSLLLKHLRHESKIRLERSARNSAIQRFTSSAGRLLALPPDGGYAYLGERMSRCAVGCVLVRKPVTKLAQHCAGVAYLWLGCPGRSSGSGQPDSPPQSPELPRDRWARGATKQSAGPSERGRALTEVSASVSGPRNRRRKSIPTLLRPHGL